MRIQPIHHTFGPHVSRKYALHADRLLLCPWKWRQEAQQAALREALSHTFDASAHLFGSGREALLALLRSLQFEQGAEVIIQGFTCVALPNAIHAAGYTPVYADIDTCSLNMNLDAVQGRINNRTRAIICQHTFGIPADTASLRKLCDQHNLVLIEDCAHVIPDNLGPKEIGKNGEYILVSFGRDKAISGVVGGAILSRKKETTVSLQKEEEQAAPPSRSTVLRALLYPALYHKGRMVYGLLGIGKVLLFVAGKLQLLLPVLTKAEKQGVMSPLIHTMPEPCAALALAELSSLQETNNHRRILTKNYAVCAQKNGWNMPTACTDLPLQKFPLLVPQADTLRKKLKQQNIYLDDSWTGAVVCPRTVNQEATNYVAGSCPHAERVAQTIFTLPTHPTMKEKQSNSLLSLLTSLLA